MPESSWRTRIQHGLRKRCTTALTMVKMEARGVMDPLEEVLLNRSPKLTLPRAPVPRLRICNRPPTDSEVSLIRDAIAMVEAEAERLSTRFWKRRAKGIRNRSWERTSLQKISLANQFVREHKGFISVVRRLPPEIWQEIFLWFAHQSSLDRSQHRAKDAPWKLGMVCQTWRSAALAFPKLWTTLPAVQLVYSRSTTKSQLKYIGELLHRSRNAPLDICILAGYLYHEGSHPVLDLLLQYVERWETLMLEIGWRFMSSFNLIEGRLSSLKTLNLTFSTISSPPARFNFFAKAPLLTAVTLTEPPSELEITLPHSQLIHYTETVSETFTSCRMRNATVSPQLETLTVLLVDNISMTRFPLPVITLPRLTKLHVVFTSREHNDFFDNVTIPAIEEITIISGRSDGRVIESIIVMLSKSSPSPLKSLLLRVGFIGKDKLSSLLALAPSLQNLDVDLPHFCSDISQLAFGYRDEHLVPLLETCFFCLGGGVIKQDTADALNALAAVRCERRNTNSADLDIFPGKVRVRRLNNLSLNIGIYPWGHFNQCALEKWMPTTVSAELTRLKEALHEKYPELSSTYTAKRTVSPPLSADFKVWQDKVDQILAKIDSVEVKDVRDIYFSNIHCSLKTLAHSWALRGHNEKASAILNKWDPSIKKSLDNRHWTLKGLYSLAYIADDDVLRTSLGIFNIAFGLKEDPYSSSAFWPMGDGESSFW